MDRGIVYPGAVPLETDLLFAQRASMVGLSKLAAAILGTGTLVNGLAVTQTTVASMNVQVAAGEIYQLASLDATAYSSLSADTTHQIVKQGVNLDTTLLALTAPGTGGFSINYLIQATLSEADTTPVVLPYYNASNPATAYSGPAGAGTAQNTRRTTVVTLSAKAGTAAATGSQTTPSPDAGNVGLAVVTVANGAVTVVNANISAYAAAPYITETLTQKSSGARVQTFTSSGTFTVPTNVTKIYVSGCAGGGGGGNGASGSSQIGSAGGGGGAGQSAVRQPYTVTPGQAIAITVGAAGAAQGAGGNTVVGTPVSLTLTGGGAGSTGVNVASPAAGAGGGSGFPPGATAPDTTAGGGGSAGGAGASTPFGGGGPGGRSGTASGANGSASGGSGAGGGGGGGYYIAGAGVGGTGGAGTAGLVIVEW